MITFHFQLYANNNLLGSIRIQSHQDADTDSSGEFLAFISQGQFSREDQGKPITRGSKGGGKPRVFNSWYTAYSEAINRLLDDVPLV